MVDLSYTNNTGLPSVSDIISLIISGKKFAFTKEHANRGRIVHKACELRILGEVFPEDLEELCRPYTGYLKSLIGFDELDNVTPIYVEKRCTDYKLGFTGQMDCLCTWEGLPGIGIIDWKTSIAVQPWWKIQLAAYAYLCNNYLVGSDYKIDWVASIRIRKSGTSPLVNIYGEQDVIEEFASSSRKITAKYINLDQVFEERFLPLLNLHNIFKKEAI